ncbi:MAG: FecR domain-containing protein [Candidatus Omnitrophota bacterium]
MKKFSVFFLALFLAFSVPTIPVVPAQMSVPTSAPVSAPASVSPVPVTVIPPAIDRVGVVAAAGGKVELTTFGQAGRIAQSGQPIFMGDEVKTDAAGHLQILLLDETVFTIGPNSTITIDKFVYDPKSHNGEIKASITQGVFRYVSGKIAAKNPDSVKVKLPTASLGFRGTIVGGSVGANGQGLTALLGPGKNNDAGARNGSFTVDGTGGDHQDVNRTGFGVEVGADGGVSDVFQLSDAQINGLTQGLGGGQGGGGGQQGGGGDSGGGLGGNTDMGALSGEDKAVTGNNVALVSGLDNVSNSMNDVSILGAQNAANDIGSTMPNGTTTYEQLQATSGSGHYANSGTYSGGGSLFVQGNIVFGPSGSIGSGNSYISISQSTRFDSTSIAGGGGTSFAGRSGPTTDLSWHETSSGGNFDFTVALSNNGGVVAQNAVVNVTYTNTGGSTYPTSGSGTVSATLSPGLV